MALIGIGLMSYVGWRAVTLSFTHDESYTFTRFIDLTVGRIMTYDHSILPNNHILNTLLMKLVHMTLGDDPAVLRLPNWLALGLYLTAAAACTRFLRNRSVRFGGFVLLAVNVYLMDFFGLARGYGLGAALMMASVYGLLCYVERPGYRPLFLSLSAATLAVIANFILLNYFLVLLIVLNLVFVDQWTRSDAGFSLLRFVLRKNSPLILNFLVLTCLLYLPLSRIVRSGTLFGGDTDFWSETVRSMARTYLYHQPWIGWQLVVQIVIAAAAVAALVDAGAQTRRWPRNAFDTNIYLTALLWLSVLASISQHWLLDTPYLTDRTALFYVPLLALTLVFLIDRWAEAPAVGRAVRATMFCLVLLACLNFVVNRNFTHTAEWRYDAQNEEVLRDLAQLRERQDGPDRVYLGVTWLLEPSLNFYRRTWSLSWLAPLGRRLQPAAPYQYFLLLPRDRLGWSGPDLELIRHYSLSGVTLFRRMTTRQTPSSGPGGTDHGSEAPRGRPDTDTPRLSGLRLSPLGRGTLRSACPPQPWLPLSGSSARRPSGPSPASPVWIHPPP